MLRSLLFLFVMLIAVSCSSYKWVDTSKCPEKVGDFMKCKIVE